ncbi:MAG: DUF4159 domain-containing protein [Candidatus Marinimicrobia bacterium]|jgi:hypothetical protein|nr:DUF4159 domain-containing protein [Candidatus Neomarinimicrobiota bacterium]MBT3496058.1 DUF4159 domain-containing protein [Candidatus Neomarinimicrobiota bacterium]MBT3692837.1 DUF4159 domain-containing protein [Candidatus Neomarinimicrobiota bacterium]MBT3732187.1 DUF4159 domain-containing protein [Candidatus Neomarinimicrobiota bacterium]MBT4144852.1 DUF4159 domain-containing protein [Candidatus Neomarinimicrobiota bacterium]
MKKIILITALSIFGSSFAQQFTIARVQYSGGGDWYGDPSSLPNLLSFLDEQTPMHPLKEEIRVKLSDSELSHYPYLYMTGHGNIRLTDKEIITLRSALQNGAFLHVDDNYGMDESLRREMKKVFPHKDFIELPHDHPIFHTYFKMENGLPKIHEHDGKPPQAFGLFKGEKLLVVYTYESDLGDGWEDESVHHDTWEIREKALQMGVNIIYFALTQ